jgi:hypothetical protein
MHYVYVYRDPRPRKNNAPVYVGKGSKERAFEHWRQPYRCKNKQLSNLLNLLRRGGLEPSIEIVWECETEREALNKEIELIGLYGRSDLGKGPLFNCTDGGEGIINIGPEALCRRSKSIKAKYNTLDMKEKQSIRIYEAWKDPKVRMAIMDKLHKRIGDPAYRALLSKTITESHANPEVRAKIGKTSREHWEDPVYRKKCMKAMKKKASSPEEKERKSLATKAGWANEETRRKRTEGIKASYTQELKAIRSATNKANWTEEKRAAFAIQMQIQCTDPEHLKRRSEAAKKAWTKRKGQ